MRIAVLPLDSRPPNWQFPQRLGDIARAEVIVPPRKLLGTLRSAADTQALGAWLLESSHGADALVVSWDALVYGGLVQSRSDEYPAQLEETVQMLRSIDWSSTAGYLYLTVPRLGTTVASAEGYVSHELLREYLSLSGDGDREARKQARLEDLREQLGSAVLERTTALRRRNLDAALLALALSTELGLRSCHVAVEDNAPSGPHLAELDELRRAAAALRNVQAREGHGSTRFTFFDGADECACLLTARAVLDQTGQVGVPVRLTTFPRVPEPSMYRGLFETHNLEDGLHFLARFLGIEFRSTGRVQWLVCYGTQPQPDAFAARPSVIFNNPYLVPLEVQGSEPLFVTDLAACNGGNPALVSRIAYTSPGRLTGLCAWNTNFNCLATTAAWLVLATLPQADAGAGRRFMLERLIDDFAYQGSAREAVLDRLRQTGASLYDFEGQGLVDEPDLTSLVHVKWAELAGGTWAAIAAHDCGEDCMPAISFPWHRAFEIEVAVDSELA